MCPARDIHSPRATPRSRFVRGLRLGLPIFLGYLPIGTAFGLLATTVGFSAFQAVICSATAFAGAGQFIALNFLKSGASVAAVLVAATVVNLRHVLFGGTLAPHLRTMSLPIQGALAFSLTDETFAVNISDLRQGGASAASMAGVGAIAWTGWVAGTFLGAAGAAWIGDPSGWGVDFAMPAMFTALFIALAEDRRHVLIGLLAGCVAIGLPALAAFGLYTPSSWFIVIASITAATIGAVVYR